jgi:CHASE2 domain-containing sensor protein
MMHMDAEETKRAILKAEQAVGLMDSRMQHKLKPEFQASLVNAILKSGAENDLLFYNRRLRLVPPYWSLSGMMARLSLIWSRLTNGKVEDEAEALADRNARIRRSGAPRLAIAMMIALVCGVYEVGLPAELELQAARNKARLINASGDVVVIAQDQKSQKILGEVPWSRRHDAALLDRLREMGAKTIIFNNAFANPTNEVDDRAFATALDKARGKVWLAAYFEESGIPKTLEPVVPIPLFRSKSQQAHNYLRFDAFGYINNVRFSEKVGVIDYPSAASVLAGINARQGDLRPDTAIRYNSVPTISVADILDSKVGRSSIAGKSVVIADTATSGWDNSFILGQGSAPNVYAIVLAAETIKNGVAREFGWLPAFIAALLIGVACVLCSTPKERKRIAICGGAVMLALMLIGDRIGLHFEMVPGLLALMVFGVRDAMQGQLITAATADPVSGLPSLSAIKFIPGYQKCAVGALQVEKYAGLTKGQTPECQRGIVRTIASRINIIFPNNVIHQGDDGLFIWLIKPGEPINRLAASSHLQALFRMPIISQHHAHDIGVATGFGYDMQTSFEARLAVASDRAIVSVFVTLRAV